MLLCFFAIFVLLGCKGNPMVGDWTATTPVGSTTLTFKADKTFEGKMGGTTIMNGTYAVEGKNVTMKATNVGAMSVPNSTTDSGQTATLSDDGKSLNMSGVSFTKQ